MTNRDCGNTAIWGCYVIWAIEGSLRDLSVERARAELEARPVGHGDQPFQLRIGSECDSDGRVVHSILSQAHFTNEGWRRLLVTGVSFHLFQGTETDDELVFLNGIGQPGAVTWEPSGDEVRIGCDVEDGMGECLNGTGPLSQHDVAGSSGWWRVRFPRGVRHVGVRTIIEYCELVERSSPAPDPSREERAPAGREERVRCGRESVSREESRGGRDHPLGRRRAPSTALP